MSFYRRRWRDLLRKSYWRECVHCQYSERYTPNRPARYAWLLEVWVGIGLLIFTIGAAAYGGGRVLGAW
jgi:hypothetical protein